MLGYPRTLVMLLVLVALGCAGEDGPAAPADDLGDEKLGVEGNGEEPAAKGEFPAELLPERVVPDLKLIVPEPGGMALFSEVVTLDAGDDITLCTFTDQITDEISYIHNTVGHQSHYGHHVVLYYLPKPEEVGTRDCGNMERLRLVLGGAGGDNESAYDLPGNIATQVPAGAQLVVNHHWINYGEKSEDVQAIIVTVPPDSTDADDVVVARAMALTTIGFSIPPASPGSATIECELEEEATALMMLGHAHERATWVKAERIKPDGTEEVLFDHAFLPEMALNPKVFVFPVEDDPLKFEVGDKIRMRCDWENDTNEEIKYPTEMCAFFANTIADDDMTCVGGSWL